MGRGRDGRGRDGSYLPPPAQIRTCGNAAILIPMRVLIGEDAKAVSGRAQRFLTELAIFTSQLSEDLVVTTRTLAALASTKDALYRALW